MKASEKIQKLIEMGTIPAQVSKFTSVPNNTVVRIWRGETEISKIQLGNAESLANYYDYLESVLYSAIILADTTLHKIGKASLGLQDENLFNRLRLTPFSVLESLRYILSEPTFKNQYPQYKELLQQAELQIESYLSIFKSVKVEKLLFTDERMHYLILHSKSYK